MSKLSLKFTLLIIPFFFFSCATAIIQRYYPSPDLAIDLEDKFSKYDKKIKIGSVSGCYTLNDACRMGIPIKTPQNEGFCTYIKNAFVIELKQARLYSPDADTEIEIEFKEIKFNSLMEDSYWKYSVRISSKNTDPFDVSSKYRFSTSYSANDACKQVANAFSGSVEKLLKDITSDPKFIVLFEQKKTDPLSNE